MKHSTLLDIVKPDVSHSVLRPRMFLPTCHCAWLNRTATNQLCWVLKGLSPLKGSGGAAGYRSSLNDIPAVWLKWSSSNLQRPSDDVEQFAWLLLMSTACKTAFCWFDPAQNMNHCVSVGDGDSGSSSLEMLRYRERWRERLVLYHFPFGRLALEHLNVMPPCRRTSGLISWFGRKSRRSSDSDSSDAARLLLLLPSLCSLRQAREILFVSAKLFNCLDLLSSRRGTGGGEGEPGRGGAHRQTKAPASPQRALPFPAVWEPPCHPHQVWQGRPPLRPLHASLPVSYFLPPPLSTSPGGSAAWLCWTRLNQCFHTLTKRWVRVEGMNRTTIGFQLLIVNENGGQG